jgi:hypothetical protein
MAVPQARGRIRRARRSTRPEDRDRAERSGTQALSLELLKRHGIKQQISELQPLSRREAADRLLAGDIDAAFMVACMLYMLRHHIDLVRTGLKRQADRQADKVA